jgi:hypothetical protein
VRPVAAKWFMKNGDGGQAAGAATGKIGAAAGIGLGGLTFSALLAWLAVGLPLAWGVYRLLDSALKIFS